MNAREEQVRRLALKRRRKLGSLSDEAFHELELAVRDDPQRFVDDEQEEAFALVAQALAAMDASHRDDDLLDDEQYLAARARRLSNLAAACEPALELDPACHDAALLRLLAADSSLDDLLDGLFELDERIADEEGGIQVPAAGDAWADVFVRPRLRIHAAIARTCLNTARYRMACDRCAQLLAEAPIDALGARFTYALALARLEDEDGFNWLDAREGRRGNAWFHLSRVVLMYKLGRMPAARRALRGYDALCPGGAYVLLQPVYVDTYLPDRPAFEPGGFEEAMLAVHEADPIIADVPDFAAWACDQPGFLDSAQRYCERNGLDWREW